MSSRLAYRLVGHLLRGGRQKINLSRQAKIRFSDGGWANGKLKVENGKLTIPRPLREREEFQVESVSLKLRNSGVGLSNGKWKVI